ncbi:MAG: hypothetical protein FWE25_02275 [Lachnospiraceae bacterium]|nr:hypothetical protein [Lachnospiraceae bacterium]
MKKMVAFIVLSLLFLVACTKNESDIKNETQSDLKDVVIFELESESDNRTDISEELSFDEATRHALHYFSELLDEDLKGKYLLMEFLYTPQISLSTWSAHVFNFMPGLVRDEIDWFASPIFVLIDAYTGELIHLFNEEVEPLHGLEMEDILDMSQEEFLEWFPAPEQREIERAKEAAKDFAAQIFRDTDVNTARLGSTHWPDYDLSMGTMDFDFVIIDSTGKVIDVKIQRDTHILLHIHTPWTAEQLNMMLE